MTLPALEDILKMRGVTLQFSLAQLVKVLIDGGIDEEVAKEAVKRGWDHIMSAVGWSWVD